jgi:hypothetical protein
MATKRERAERMWELIWRAADSGRHRDYIGVELELRSRHGYQSSTLKAALAGDFTREQIAQRCATARERINAPRT